MSYGIIAIIRQDPWIRDRVSACIAVEGMALPDDWATTHGWELAAQDGWATAWQDALTAHPEEGYRPGADDTVITDEMILTAVQALNQPA